MSRFSALFGRNRSVPVLDGDSKDPEEKDVSRTEHNRPHTLSPHRAGTLAVALGALGVVYGDIGAGPLYSIKECFHGLHAISLTEGNVFGVLSLVFWSLTMVVSVKYVAFILRADNKGEGGIYALPALVPSDRKKVSPRLHSAVIIAGVFGAAPIRVIAA